MAARVRLDGGSRVIAAAVAIACLGVLIVAAGLTRDPAGHGTHEQLGLPACGWAMVLNAPCPTCGMTTSFTAFADGDPVTAIVTQPLGATLALLAAGAFWGGAWAAVTGDRIWAVYQKLLGPRLLWGAGIAAAAAWAYKAVTW